MNRDRFLLLLIPAVVGFLVVFGIDAAIDLHAGHALDWSGNALWATASALVRICFSLPIIFSETRVS